jgi:hypothetical protein
MTMESIPEAGIANIAQSTASFMPIEPDIVTPMSFHGLDKSGSEFAFTAKGAAVIAFHRR